MAAKAPGITPFSTHAHEATAFRFMWQAGTNKAADGRWFSVLDLSFDDHDPYEVHVPDNAVAPQQLLFRTYIQQNPIYKRPQDFHILQIEPAAIKTLRMSARIFKDGENRQMMIRDLSGRTSYQQIVVRSDRLVEVELPSDPKVGEIYCILLTSDSSLNLKAKIVKEENQAAAKPAEKKEEKKVDGVGAGINVQNTQATAEQGTTRSDLTQCLHLLLNQALSNAAVAIQREWSVVAGNTIKLKAFDLTQSIESVLRPLPDASFNTFQALLTELRMKKIDLNKHEGPDISEKLTHACITTVGRSGLKEITKHYLTARLEVGDSIRGVIHTSIDQTALAVADGCMQMLKK